MQEDSFNINNVAIRLPTRFIFTETWLLSRISERRSWSGVLPIRSPSQAWGWDEPTAESCWGVPLSPHNHFYSHSLEDKEDKDSYHDDATWYHKIKRPYVYLTEFHLLVRVKGEITVSVSGNLILRGTCVEFIRSRGQPPTRRQLRALEDYVAFTLERLVPEHW